MKKFFLILAIALMAIPALAQENTYTRGKGFFVRPDVYGGFFANAGYQFNPYVQVSAGPGLLLILSNSVNNNLSIDLAGSVHGGVRVYTGKKPWTGLIDYHLGAMWYDSDLIWRHALVGGASYKDLDFGGGVQVMMNPNTNQVIGAGVLVTVGYNFRFYKH
ncbi:MAG: hypothetical protein II887_05930 [Bacteroidales bacterium]|nr:hypothetical protein [Bacteroidales bacterium]